DRLAPEGARMTLPFGLGALRLAAPAALFALLVVPLFFAAARRARRGLPAAICRSAAALAVVFVLADPRLEMPRPERGACVIAAIDVSASVQDAAVDTARAFLARLMPRLGPDDVAGSVAFAAHARVIAHPAASLSALRALLPAHVDAAPDRLRTRAERPAAVGRGREPGAEAAPRRARGAGRRGTGGPGPRRAAARHEPRRAALSVPRRGRVPAPGEVAPATGGAARAGP